MPRLGADAPRHHPGITGLWQVLGRTNIPFDEMVKLDYMYVTGWSLSWDIKLLLQTVPAVLEKPRGVLRPDAAPRRVYSGVGGLCANLITS